LLRTSIRCFDDYQVLQSKGTTMSLQWTSVKQ
jgi:hypothetical protein